MHPEFFNAWWGGLALILYIIHTSFYKSFYKSCHKYNKTLFAYKYHYSSKIDNIKLLILSPTQNPFFFYLRGSAARRHSPHLRRVSAFCNINKLGNVISASGWLFKKKSSSSMPNRQRKYINTKTPERNCTKQTRQYGKTKYAEKNNQFHPESAWKQSSKTCMNVQ